MSEQPVIYGWIFARGGSKGFPGKNIAPLCGKPLIAWAIDAAKASKYIQHVFVSTDCKHIASVAQKYGAEVPFIRPSELATDRAPERLAWRHAIEWIRQQKELSPMDVMVSVPSTSPLRMTEDIDACIELFLQGGAETVIGITPSERHPSFNMVSRDGDGYVRLLMPLNKMVSCRQEAPAAYNIATAVYVTDPEFVLRTNSYMEGRVRGYILPVECGIDIDTEIDFKLAELLLTQRKGVEQ